MENQISANLKLVSIPCNIEKFKHKIIIQQMV